MTLASTEIAPGKTVAIEQQARKQFLRRIPAYTLAYIILVLGVIVSLFPYFLALLTSLKPSNQIFSSSAWSLPHPLTVQNYVQVITQYSFLQYIWHSLLFAAITTIGQLIFSTLAAYAFARMEFPGRDQIFWLYLSTMMVPNIVTLIPLFILLRTFTLVNTWAGLVLPYILGTPYGIFLMR
jgi:multiple sugar transport system permease protein